MRAAVLEIPTKDFAHSAYRIGTKNAWAKYVRNRWRANTLAEIQREWDLTEGQARGLLYAQASQSTIDAVLDSMSPLKAFGLGLEILSIRLNVKLEDYITHQAEEAARERVRFEAEERRLAILSARIAERRSFCRDGPDEARAGRPTDEPLGQGANGRTVGGRNGGRP